jgi:hypothetical protein
MTYGERPCLPAIIAHLIIPWRAFSTTSSTGTSTRPSPSPLPVRRILIDPASYIEGVVRGYRNALLTSQNYSNLTQCENIDGTSAPIASPAQP